MHDDRNAEPTDPGSAAGDAPESEPDTEGHSLFQADFHRRVASARSREADDWARGEAARKAARKRDDGKR